MNSEQVKLKLNQINPTEYNPRNMRDQNFKALKETIKRYGQVENLIVNKDGTLISGHMRYRALEELGIYEADCIVVDLSKEDEKLLNLTMNNKALTGEYDESKLGDLLAEIKLYDETAYNDLRLNDLQPIGDLRGYDNSRMNSAAEYETKTDRQITLIYTNADYEDITHKTERLSSLDPEAYPHGHKYLFLKLIEEEYERQRTQATENN